MHATRIGGCVAMCRAWRSERARASFGPSRTRARRARPGREVLTTEQKGRLLSLGALARVLGFIKKLWTGIPYLCRVAAPRRGHVVVWRRRVHETSSRVAGRCSRVAAHHEPQLRGRAPMRPARGQPRGGWRSRGRGHVLVVHSSACVQGVNRLRARHQRADEIGRHLLLHKDVTNCRSYAAPPRPFMIVRC
jgi:hypothetical protein